MTIHYVNPINVKLADRSHWRDIRKQETLLQNQGQIVPLLASKDAEGNTVIDNKDYPYATAQVVAARELGWSTIIVTYEDASD